MNKNKLNPVLTDIIDQFVVKYDEFHEVSNLKSNLKSGLNGTDPISFENIIEEQVNSLLVNFKWHQWYPYNIFFSWNGKPQYIGCPVGCMTIALGQIIAYDNYYVDPVSQKGFDWTKMESAKAAADNYMEINFLLEKIYAKVITSTSTTGQTHTLENKVNIVKKARSMRRNFKIDSIFCF